MGNRHNKQRILQKEQQQQHINMAVVTSTSGCSSSRSLLPILCSRTSINDVAAVPSIRFDHHRLHNDEDDDRSQHSSSSSSIITDELEPISPKVGCMGQVNKSKRSNRVAAGRPPNNITIKNNTTTTTTRRSLSNANNNTNAVVVAVNYSKLGRLFSGKKLLPPVAPSSITTTTRIRSKQTNSSRHQTKQQQQQQSLGFIREMDPPLPVILPKKKLQPPQEEDQDQDGEQGHSSILWKRRFGDVSALKTLEINQLSTVQCRRRPPPPPQPLTV